MFKNYLALIAIFGICGLQASEQEPKLESNFKTHPNGKTWYQAKIKDDDSTYIYDINTANTDTVYVQKIQPPSKHSYEITSAQILYGRVQSCYGRIESFAKKDFDAFDIAYYNGNCDHLLLYYSAIMQDYYKAQAARQKSDQK